LPYNVTAPEEILGIQRGRNNIEPNALIVFAKTKDGTEGSDWVVVVSSLVAVTSFVSVTGGVACRSVLS